MRIENMNWMMVEKYLKKDNRVMMILGACEQHGYLSLQTDTRIPLAIADGASEKTGVLIAPPLNFGNSPSFLSYPGTISFRVTTLMAAAEDMVRSLYGVGFRRFLFHNGHGGNMPVRNRMHEIMNELTDIRVCFYSWWTEENFRKVITKHQVEGFHGGWMESFKFNRVAPLPAGTKVAPHPARLLNREEEKKVYKDGIFGGAWQPDDAVLDEIMQVAIEDTVELLKFK
jgi:creatinine amidohydrolase